MTYRNEKSPYAAALRAAMQIFFPEGSYWKTPSNGSFWKVFCTPDIANPQEGPNCIPKIAIRQVDKYGEPTCGASSTHTPGSSFLTQLEPWTPEERETWQTRYAVIVLTPEEITYQVVGGILKLFPILDPDLRVEPRMFEKAFETEEEALAAYDVHSFSALERAGLRECTIDLVVVERFVGLDSPKMYRYSPIRTLYSPAKVKSI